MGNGLFIPRVQKKTSDSIEFCLDIPADSEAKVVFEYRIDRRKEIIIK